MDPYKPWLIPLLEDFPGKPEKFRSSLEEEKALQPVMESRRLDWPAIANLVREAYGITFIHGGHESCRLLGKGEAKEANHNARFLVLNNECREYFVLNHPEEITLFDKYAEEGQKIALARPSLFRQLWLQQPCAEDSRAETKRLLPPGHPGSEPFSLFVGEMVSLWNPSDWHLEARSDHYRSRVRVHGELKEMEQLTHEKAGWLINSLFACCGLPEQIVRFPVEGSFDLSLSGESSISARCSMIPSIYGLAVAIRFFDRESLLAEGLQGLGMTLGQVSWLEDRFQSKDGFWLVAGPTGSGKSTTLHALLKWSVRSREKVLAVEDPVERILEGVQQVSIDDPPGLAFPYALRAFLRQSPDTILIGEIRDSETAAIALQASRTGHRVLSTLHAGSIKGVFSRFEDLGQPPPELEQTGRVLMLQRLVPVLCAKCARMEPVAPEIQAGLLRAGLNPPKHMPLATGCAACEGGVAGRTGIFSVTPFEREADGNSQLRKAAWELILAGKISMPAMQPFVPPEIPLVFPVCQP